jgi:hypothetical protein
MTKTRSFLLAGALAGVLFGVSSLRAQDDNGQSSGTPPPPPPTHMAPKVDISKLPPDSTQTGLTFTKDIAPMLKASCANCHSGDKPKSGMSVTALATTMKNAKGHVEIVPGHSEKSRLVWYVADLVKRREMPPLNAREKNPALTPDQIGILRAWIDQGAKE